MKILLISDIHGNADALKTVLESSGKWDYLWILGDLVDYGPEPHVVVDLVKSIKPDLIISGNHDYAVAYGVDCGCAQELHELSVYTRENISMKLLSKDQISWLKTLPHKIKLEAAGRKIHVTHGSPRSPLYGYLKPNLTKEEMFAQLINSQLGNKPIDADIVAVGHTHIPMNTMVNNVHILNPGSCGQPRDGDPRASYAILDAEHCTFEQYRVRYEVDNVLLKLRSLRLDSTYLKWLIHIYKTGRALSKEQALT